MIHDATRLPLPLRLDADICIVGSGPGGATVAMRCAEAGMRVVLLEAGELITPADMNQREEDMLPRLFADGGNRTSADRRVHIHQGRGVGGSSLHNLNLCKRIPLAIRERWRQERGLAALPPERWDALYDEAEALIAVTAVLPAQVNRHNALLAAGGAVLGWSTALLHHNRTGCLGSGFCELGCAYDAKNNALKVCVRRAVTADADVLTSCRAARVVFAAGVVSGVEAVAVDPADGRSLGRIHVQAPRVCLAASATGTAALLLRSEVPDPGRETGRRLRVHPAGVVAGDFEEPVHAWEGIPQTVECTEWLQLDREDGHRTWIVPAFAHPIGTATFVPGIGAAHRALMERYAHLAVLTAMIHDRTAGHVLPRGEHGLRIDYVPDADDEREIAFGVEACVRLLLAAGARRVLIPTPDPIVISAGAPSSAYTNLDLRALGLTAVHPMGSVPMGDDPAVAAVDGEGRHHHVAGLWIADASLFPSSIGVPPQLSVYAMGLHVSDAIRRAG